MTALDEVNNQWMGRPIEYFKADNASDPVQAVDKARQLVESNKIQVMLGPIFSPSNAAVTDYLAKGGGGIPSISIFGQPTVNLKTANKLSFIPAGMMSMDGYVLGKYAAETLGYKTANAISLEDTTGHELMKGFRGASKMAAARSSVTVRADRHGGLQLIPHHPQAGRLHLQLDLRQRHRAVHQAVPRLRPDGAAGHDHGRRPAGARPCRSSATSRSVSSARTTTSPPIDNRAEQEVRGRVREDVAGRAAEHGLLRRLHGRDDVPQAVKETNGDTSPEALKTALPT